MKLWLFWFQTHQNIEHFVWALLMYLTVGIWMPLIIATWLQTLIETDLSKYKRARVNFIWADTFNIWVETDMYRQKKRVELNLLLIDQPLTLRSGPKLDLIQKMPGLIIHCIAHWHLIVVPSKGWLGWVCCWSLPKFCQNSGKFYQLSIGTSSVRQTDFNLIGGNFEAKIFQDTGSPEKSLVATFFLTFMQAVANGQ